MSQDVGTKVTIGGEEFYLADVAQPLQRYREEYRKVSPRGQFTPNDPTALITQFDQAFWRVEDWSYGEGYPIWEPGIPGYRKSTGIRLARDGQGGLTLGHPVANTQVTGPSDYTSTDPNILDDSWTSLGVIDPGSASNDARHRTWVEASELWGSSFDLGDYDIWDGAPGGDGINYFVSNNDGDYRKHDPGGGSAANSAVNDAYSVGIAHFRGFLYYLDSGENGADPGLYRITPDGATTADGTQVWDPGDRVLRVDGFPHDDQQVYGRWIVPTDRGVAFIAPLKTGEIGIFEYNAGSSTTVQIGALPGKGAMFYDILWANDLLFVGFHSQWQYNPGGGNTYGGAGKAHVWVYANNAPSVIGPIRPINNAEGDTSVRLAGMDGDDLIIIYDYSVWAYNVTSGGISHLGELAADGGGWRMSGRVYQDGVFVGGGEQSSSYYVERMALDEYVASGTIDSGIYDLQYFDVEKMLIELVVLTDPLPADTTLQAWYALDGSDTFTSLGTSTTDDQTLHEFTISTVGSTVRARYVEIRLGLATTDSSVSPRIRKWHVRGTDAVHERRFHLLLDMKTHDRQKAHQAIAALRGLVEAQDLVTFVNPLTVDDHETPLSYSVRVSDAHLPDNITEGDNMYAQVILTDVVLVSAS